MIPAQSYLPWKISMTVLHVVSISLTGLRLERRRRTNKLWWDDYAAIPPMVINILNTVVLWFRLRYGPQPRDVRVLYSYLGSSCFVTIIWWSRISLSLAVVRITPVFSRVRRISVGMTVAFIFIWIALLSSTIARCALSREWQFSTSTVLTCGLSYWATVASISCDILGDIVLVAIPLYQLWNITLPPEERFRVRLVFSTSLLTLLSAIGLCLFTYGGIVSGPGRLIAWLMVCHIEEAVSLTVCNLLVLICWAHHHLSLERETENDSNQHTTRDNNYKATSIDSLEEILNMCSEGSTGPNQSIHSQGHSVTVSPVCSI